MLAAHRSASPTAAHYLDVIKIADWVIDLGPEGGEIISAGNPEQIAADPHSHTGRFLEPLLQRGW